MKHIYFISDRTSCFFLDEDFYTESYLDNYEDTKEAIEVGHELIYTTSMANFSFDLLDKDYQIFLVKNRKVVEIKPGMSEIEKDLRREHNILKLFLGRTFDRCFENEIESKKIQIVKIEV